MRIQFQTAGVQTLIAFQSKKLDHIMSGLQLNYTLVAFSHLNSFANASPNQFVQFGLNILVKYQPIFIRSNHSPAESQCFKTGFNLKP